MEIRYDLRKIGIHHEQEDLAAHDATPLLIKEIERLREALQYIADDTDEGDTKQFALSALQQKESE